MTGTDTPRAIAAMIDATNRGDSDAFVASFAADARIDDYGRTFAGRDGARDWDSSDNIGVGMRFRLISATAVGADEYDVVVDAASRRFTGRATLRTVLRGGLIASLATS